MAWAKPCRVNAVVVGVLSVFTFLYYVDVFCVVRLGGR